MLDRFKGAFVALARGAQHNIDYMGQYRVQVLRQPSARRLDLATTDPRLPPQMANIPLKVGVPGLDVTLTPGHFVVLMFENGRADRPYATLWDPGPQGTTPIRLVLNADQIELGDSLALPVEGVMTGQSKDFSMGGVPAWILGNASTRVGAKKS